MSTLVKASVPADQFTLAETLGAVPSATFDAVRLVSYGAEEIVPLLWVTGAGANTVTEALEADPSTAAVELVSQRNHDSLFRMRWTARTRFVTHVLVEDGGAIVSARGSGDAWTFRLLFPEREAISATYEACDEFDVRIERIQTLAESSSLGGFHLTDAQFTTIKAALDMGYYEIPRGITLEELAAELDVSHQALSERLRRGHRALVSTVIKP